MDIRVISTENREQINKFIIDHWFSTEMVIRGKVFDMTAMEGFAIYEENNIIGLATYMIENNECEIMSLDSLKEKQGIGTMLVDKVIEAAKEAGCNKVKLITTNDNLNAIGFYQKRGFDLTRIYPNAVDAARKIKPSIPILGDYNIPLKHELEFEIVLV
ncbi:GNAT family N-acetyltransferase [Inconstantimicrobium mannanitabidum]|uniref:N-acetyltransferase n=1 Tax=Inconstantimicrobium mannanitabidum TaxID=1604901 RepID=A0ACB5RA38_9CLOT|nr:GNAT family N-acetyltransferase [Clostridium sp. TW13]GKX65891.1 N-acetyltransferase [Clostridium sp. TW13]